jgi:molybdenum cofactor guanylyltransferase
MSGMETRPLPRTGIAGVILAGGGGTRLGGTIKATLEVGGRTLLERVRAPLARGAGLLLVAHGGIDPAALRLPAELVAIPDLDADLRGPLAGLAAAVEWLAAHRPDIAFLVSAAVDTPFLPEDFVARLGAAAQASGAAAVLASCDGQDYPTNALWRLAALRTLPAQVREGSAPRSLWLLAAAMQAERAAWPAGPDGDPFANANTPEELAALRQRAAHIDGGGEA